MLGQIFDGRGHLRHKDVDLFFREDLQRLLCGAAVFIQFREFPRQQYVHNEGLRIGAQLIVLIYLHHGILQMGQCSVFSQPVFRGGKRGIQARRGRQSGIEVDVQPHFVQKRCHGLCVCFVIAGDVKCGLSGPENAAAGVDHAGRHITAFLTLDRSLIVFILLLEHSIVLHGIPPFLSGVPFG